MNEKLLRSTILAATTAVCLVGAGTAVLAADCATVAAEVEQAIQAAEANGSLSGQDLADAKTLLQVGRDDCEGGFEDAALDVLQKAKSILGI